MRRFWIVPIKSIDEGWFRENHDLLLAEVRDRGAWRNQVKLPQKYWQQSAQAVDRYREDNLFGDNLKRDVRARQGRLDLADGLRRITAGQPAA